MPSSSSALLAPASSAAQPLAPASSAAQPLAPSSAAQPLEPSSAEQPFVPANKSKGKKKKKGLTEKELEALIDIELAETRTQTLLHIPGTFVKQDSEDHQLTTEKNKAYDELKKSKIGSDAFNTRGSQTLNATRKNKAD